MGTTNWTAAQKRAYAINKSKERARVAQRAEKRQGSVIKEGYVIACHEHRCEAYDLSYDEKGSLCRLCGRKYVWEPGVYDNGVWKTGRGFTTKRSHNYPLTPTMPPPCPPGLIPQRSIERAVPRGTLGELPPDDVNGAARGAWWVASWRARQARAQSSTSVA